MARGKHDKKKYVRVSDIIIDIILCGLIVLMVFSGINIYNISKKYQVGRDTYNDLADKAGMYKDRTKESSDEEEEEWSINWDALKAESEDIVAWIYQEGTEINYPVLRASNNDEYLYATPTGEYSISGSIFIDANTENPFEDDLTILYGHRMKDGSMFATLKYYFSENFFSEHPTMMLYTPEKTYEIELFSAREVYSMDEGVYKYYFGEGDKETYITRAVNENEMVGYDGRYTVSTDDKLILMSTCTVRLDDNRLTLLGIMREIEGEQNAVE